MRTTYRIAIRIGFLMGGVLLTLAVTLAVLNLLPQERRLSQPLRGVQAVTSPGFRWQASHLLDNPVIGGNRIQDYQNGNEIFPAMLDAIRHARSSINLEAYIFWSGKVMQKFVDALSDRARAGVDVHVLVDWIGARHLDDSVVRQLRSAGVDFRFFHPLHWYDADKINNRTHRRLLIVDGHTAFTGGVGIADEWKGNASRAGHWRDMLFRIEGPAVAQLQAVFEDNWSTTTGGVLIGPEYYPPLSTQGDVTAQVFYSSPQAGSEDMQLMYLMAIDGARKSIDLEAAYFVPDPLTMRALERALKRGVRVRIVVPGKDDAGFVLDASKASWGPLLRAGATMYRYQPSMFHCKMMIVDDYLTIVGSANFDYRSFMLNDEVNVNVFDHAFAEHMTRVMDGDIIHSRQLTTRQWAERPWTERAKDWLASLTDPLL